MFPSHDPGGYGVGVFADTTNSFIIQSSVVPASVKQYKLQYEVIESNGGVSFGLSGGSSAFGSVSLTNSVGVHTKFITSNGSKTNLQFHNGGNFIGKIDNISVKQVDPNDRWSLSGDWEISNGSLNIDSASIANAKQNSILTIGDTYEMNFDLSISSGYVRVYFGTSANTIQQQITSSGNYTIRGVAENTSLTFRSGTNTNCSIDNVTIREYAITPLDV